MLKRSRVVAGSGETPLEVLEDRGGGSPLIIKNLDRYPQPPTNTRSLSLNLEDPVKPSLISRV